MAIPFKEEDKIRRFVMIRFFGGILVIIFAVWLLSSMFPEHTGQGSKENAVRQTNEIVKSFSFLGNEAKDELFSYPHLQHEVNMLREKGLSCYLKGYTSPQKINYEMFYDAQKDWLFSRADLYQTGSWSDWVIAAMWWKPKDDSYLDMNDSVEDAYARQQMRRSNAPVLDLSK
jgi:hypothetical protein